MRGMCRGNLRAGGRSTSGRIGNGRGGKAHRRRGLRCAGRWRGRNSTADASAAGIGAYRGAANFGVGGGVAACWSAAGIGAYRSATKFGVGR